jgi:hypothetical protein
MRQLVDKGKPDKLKSAKVLHAHDTVLDSRTIPSTRAQEKQSTSTPGIVRMMLDRETPLFGSSPKSTNTRIPKVIWYLPRMMRARVSVCVSINECHHLSGSIHTHDTQTQLHHRSISTCSASKAMYKLEPHADVRRSNGSGLIQYPLQTRNDFRFVSCSWIA